MLNRPLSGHFHCIHSFLYRRARSSARMLRWRGARSSDEEASKSTGLRDIHTMTVLFLSAHLLEVLLPRCFTSELSGCLQERGQRSLHGPRWRWRWWSSPDPGRAF